MIIVSVQLASAVDLSVTEIARMGIDNVSGAGLVRDYECRTWRGRDSDALNRAMRTNTVTRQGKVLRHRSLDLHVWHLVAKALAGMGYGEGAEVAEAADVETAIAYLRHLATLRPADANGLRVAASDLEAGFHLDPALNPPVDRESTPDQ